MPQKEAVKKISGRINPVNLWSNIPEKLKTPVLFILIIILLALFYFPVTFGDKTIQSMDVLHNKAMREYTHKDKEGFTLWNPHLFCGMPAYATSTAQRSFDISDYLYSTTSRIYSALWKDYNAIYTFSFLVMAFTAFLFMRSRGAGRGVSIFTALGMIFSTGIVNLFFAGHATKLFSLSFLPFLLMLLLKFQKEIKLTDFLLLTLCLHLFIIAAHVQIIFYAVLTAAVYFAFYTVYGIIKKDTALIKQLGKTVLVICAASAIVFLMSYDTYSQLYEYKQYSTRTESPVNAPNTASNPSETEQYKYNTNWSFSPGEVITFLIPSFYGYGGTQYSGELTHGQEEEINTYFGQMELVNMPMYMGIIIFALALFALFKLRKEPFIIFSAITILFFVLLSFGRNFPVVYNLMYNYIPSFRNFRIPSMILNIIQILFPILAGIGVMKLIELSENYNASFVRSVRNFFFTSTGLLVLSLILNNFLAEWFINRIAEAAVDNSYKSKMLRTFAEYSAKMFLADIYIGLILLAVLCLLIWLLILKKINRMVFISALILLSLADLIRVAERGTVYINRQEIEDLFTNQKYVTAIKKQNDKEPFRIVDIRQNGISTINNNNGYYTYFLLEDISGYSAVKPKTYDDIIQNVGLGNLVFWKMANVKYAIADFPIKDPDYQEIHRLEDVYVYKYLKALPRAYFVDSVATEPKNDFYKMMQKGKFDPQKVAFTDTVDFKIEKTDSTAYSKIIKYTDEKLELEVNASGNNFLLFATTYMPVGWKAYIDGNETRIVKADHTFMGIVIPKGKHRVDFIYAPSNFYIGKYLSLSLNILVLGCLAAFVIIGKRKKKTAVL